jgi:hypothetical protein
MVWKPQWSSLHSLGTHNIQNIASKISYIAACVFIASDTCLSTLCLATTVFSCFTITSFRCNATTLIIHCYAKLTWVQFKQIESLIFTILYPKTSSWAFWYINTRDSGFILPHCIVSTAVSRWIRTQKKIEHIGSLRNPAVSNRKQKGLTDV